MVDAHRYDSGSVEGSVIKERVLVGGMALKGVEMGLVRRQEQHIRGFKADGIVGLAFPSISTTRNTSPSQHSTFVELVQEQFGAVGDLFSVYLTREWDGRVLGPNSQCHGFSHVLLDPSRDPNKKTKNHAETKEYTPRCHFGILL